MVITDRLVFIHMPKTGGTFVTEALKHLHALRVPRRFGRVRRALKHVGLRPPAPRLRYGLLLDLEPKHGTCHDIPPEYRHLPVLSNVRNPYDWYVSQFEFAWWKRAFEYHPEPHPTPVGSAIERVLPHFESEHPEFPEITFQAFVELCDRASAVYGTASKMEAGLLTRGFIRYFFRESDEVTARLDREYVRSGRYREDMFNVEFLRTNRLNCDLPEVLTARGYASEDVAFIRGLEKILPMGRGRRDNQGWEGYYSRELKDHIRDREWMLFETFPEFDV